MPATTLTNMHMFESGGLGFWKCLACGELCDEEPSETDDHPTLVTIIVTCPACGRYDRYVGRREHNTKLDELRARKE